MSRYLQRLADHARAAVDPLNATERVCLLAIAQARLGHADSACRSIAASRASLGSSPDPRQQLWIMLAEAVQAWYAGDEKLAQQKSSRLLLLSRSMHAQVMIGHAAAWSAYFYFEHSEMSRMVDALQLVVNLGDDASDDARLRCEMVLANAFNLIGDPLQAEIYFRVATTRARKLGDLASLEGLQANRALLEVARLRLQEARGVQPESFELARARASLNSALGVSASIDAHALGHYMILAHLRLALLNGEFDSAREELQLLKDSQQLSAPHVNRAALRIELEYVKWKCALPVELSEVLVTELVAELVELDLDEQLVSLTQCSRLLDGLGSGEYEALRAQISLAREHLRAASVLADEEARRMLQPFRKDA